MPNGIKIFNKKIPYNGSNPNKSDSRSTDVSSDKKYSGTQIHCLYNQLKWKLSFPMEM